MKPQKALQISLSAVFGIALILASFTANAAVSRKNLKSVTTNHEVEVAKGQKTPGHFNLVVPEAIPNKANSRDKMNHEEKNSHHQDKARHHSDEEKHKIHFYHYHRISHAKQIITNLLRLLVKVVIAVSFLSILVCGFLSMLH